MSDLLLEAAAELSAVFACDWADDIAEEGDCEPASAAFTLV